MTQQVGKNIYDLMFKAFPICRSITGNGVRQTLKLISDIIPITIYEIPTGTKAFDWEVPMEWNIEDAYIIGPNLEKFASFKENNLHVVGYSVPTDKSMSLDDLKKHLHSLPNQPDAIPYVTSYYNEDWGFCISHKELLGLKDGTYHVVINSSLKNGSLTYGEYILEGKTDKEVLISTYICHPSMANNELSGPAVVTYIAKWLAETDRKYTYRIIFIPETIGSLVYLSRNLQRMKEKTIAGFNVSCVGDSGEFSFVSTRLGNTYADKVIENVLRQYYKFFRRYSFLHRGSDERQFCSPNIDLPVVSVCRSKYEEYDEYHTSLDNMNFVDSESLGESYDMLVRCIETIEMNAVFKNNCYGEPRLGKRGLYPNMCHKNYDKKILRILDLCAYIDGKNDLIDLSNILNVSVHELMPIVNRLAEENLIEKASGTKQY